MTVVTGTVTLIMRCSPSGRRPRATSPTDGTASMCSSSASASSTWRVVALAAVAVSLSLLSLSLSSLSLSLSSLSSLSLSLSLFSVDVASADRLVKRHANQRQVACGVHHPASRYLRRTVSFSASASDVVDCLARGERRGCCSREGDRFRRRRSSSSSPFAAPPICRAVAVVDAVVVVVAHCHCECRLVPPPPPRRAGRRRST